jgi:hypothetical protein
VSPDSDYAVLGMPPGASMEELKTAYRDLVKVWHPDRFAGNPRLQRKAQEKLKEINLAYERLQSLSTSSASGAARGGKRTAERPAPPPPPPPHSETGPASTSQAADGGPQRNSERLKATKPTWLVLAGLVAVALVSFSLLAEHSTRPESAGNRSTPQPEPRMSPEVRDDLREKAAPERQPSRGVETKPGSEPLVIERPDCQQVLNPDGTLQVYRTVHADGRVTYTNCRPRPGSQPPMTQPPPDCSKPGGHRRVMEDGTVVFVNCPPKERAEGP